MEEISVVALTEPSSSFLVRVRTSEMTLAFRRLHQMQLSAASTKSYRSRRLIHMLSPPSPLRGDPYHPPLSDPILRYSIPIDFVNLLDSDPPLAYVLFSQMFNLLPLFDRAAQISQGIVLDGSRCLEKGVRIKELVHVRINVSGFTLESLGSSSTWYLINSVYGARLEG